MRGEVGQWLAVGIALNDQRGNGRHNEEFRRAGSIERFDEPSVDDP